MSESLIATGHPRTSPRAQLSGTSGSDVSDETRHSQLRRKRMTYEEVRTLQAGSEAVRACHAGHSIRAPRRLLITAAKSFEAEGELFHGCFVAFVSASYERAQGVQVPYPGED